MTTSVEAIYEQGVLRLIQPLSLAEGTRVEVIVIVREPTAEGRKPADILAAIAALPMDTGGEDSLAAIMTKSSTVTKGPDDLVDAGAWFASVVPVGLGSCYGDSLAASKHPTADHYGLHRR